MAETHHNHPIKVAALYRFARFSRHAEMREKLAGLCRDLGIKGTLILANEGINGTIAGVPAAIDQVVEFLGSIPELGGMEIKYSHALTMPFHRMKVKLKKEIVTMGVPGTDPLAVVGTYVEPRDWNELIADPQTVVIDTRNDYEYKVGSFEKAIDPNTKAFTEFPDWLRARRQELAGKKVAMFCTGGIRCEKATAYAKEIGLTDVFHLKGGILAYLEQVPKEASLWKGECFVFDERVTVGHALALGDAVLCRACRTPLTEEDRNSDQYFEGLSCPHCHGSRTDKDRARYAERHKQMQLADQRGMRHLGS